MGYLNNNIITVDAILTKNDMNPKYFHLADANYIGGLTV